MVSTKPSSGSSSSSNVDGDASVLIATKKGLTYLDVRQWTLESKETAMHSFQYPRHDRLGLTAECGLASFGDINDWTHNVQDSDSIWTSQQIVAASLRYHYTINNNNNNNNKDYAESLRLEAWKGF